jgi:hypothetical protein
LHTVFSLLEQSGLVINTNKCIFDHSSIGVPGPPHQLFRYQPSVTSSGGDRHFSEASQAPRLSSASSIFTGSSSLRQPGWCCL